jgi:hypothetical protein
MRRVEVESVEFVIAHDRLGLSGIDKFADGLEDSPIVRTTIDEVSQKDDLSIRIRVGPTERAPPPPQPTEGSVEFGGLAVNIWNDVNWVHAGILGLFSVLGLAQPPHRSEPIRGP